MPTAVFFFSLLTFPRFFFGNVSPFFRKTFPSELYLFHIIKGLPYDAPVISIITPTGTAAVSATLVIKSETRFFFIVSITSLFIRLCSPAEGLISIPRRRGTVPLPAWFLCLCAACRFRKQGLSLFRRFFRRRPPPPCLRLFLPYYIKTRCP